VIVYKYLHPDRVDVLETGTIRFTQSAALNDPFETHPCFTELEDSFRKRQQAIVDRQQLSRDAYVLASLTIPKRVKQGIERFKDQISNELCILSLTTRRNNLLMWSHYTAAHRGFVIGFDFGHPFFAGKSSTFITPLTSVQYSNKRRMCPGIERVRESLKELADAVIFNKSEHWAYEEEYRMVSHPKRADRCLTVSGGQNIYLYSFPSEALREIIFGHLMSKHLRNRIREIASEGYPSVELFDAHLSKTDFDLEIRRLK